MPTRQLFSGKGMARIVLISKYPPIEGGIAAKTFWLARSLAQRGHKVHIVTDRLGIAPEYSLHEYEDPPDTENLFVHRPDTKVPWHIPNNNHFDLDLLNTTVQVIKEYDADVIDTGYLIPYGVVACLASRMTGIPYILRHGGSDIHKFVLAGVWKDLLEDVFSNSALTITDKIGYDVVSRLSSRVEILHPYVPDATFFKSIREENGQPPTLALIGKANYYWRHKGWHKVIEIMKALGSKFKLVVVSQGIGFQELRKCITQSIGANVEWRDFCHPSEMPELLNSVEGALLLSGDLPFPAFSNLLLEALFCGKLIITDNPDILQSYQYGLNLERFTQNILPIPVDDFETAAKTISERFEKVHTSTDVSGQPQAIAAKDYQTYIRKNENAMLSVL